MQPMIGLLSRRAVLLRLRYVDQRGDDVLTKAVASPSSPINPRKGTSGSPKSDSTPPVVGVTRKAFLHSRGAISMGGGGRLL
jgi:hypothetical protein